MLDEKNDDVKVPEQGNEESSSDSSQNESSSEVKRNEPMNQNSYGDSKEDMSKLKQQVENLNIALKKEREEGGKKVEQLRAKLDETSSLYDRMKNVFVPEERNDEEYNSNYATKDELESIVNQKLQQLKEEQIQNQKVEAWKQEIKSLENEWNGKNGKPVYNDEQVLNWQRENNKVYLSPKEAFLQMKHDDILDYQVKQKLSSINSVENVETPSNVPGEHNPENTNSRDRNINLNTRDAIREALEEADKEM